MTRKECIDYIKSNGYGMEATKVARNYTGCAGANYTNLPTSELIKFVEGKENTKKPVAKKVAKTKPLDECADKNARNAIMAIAELIGYKNIKKFFN